ncbi:uncharacterized protein TrAFT101_005852 [Trichoderma asperellum]|uniref:uncharacterized protein n=1 Tax=Trichoderma asperellum TaxID=101201 RepID=UPI00331F4FFA|nr:hypothetical protein TrAFT101_005852 [Trichoderma asperellum]
MAPPGDSPKPFHLFGNLFLDDLETYLEEHRLAELKTLQPHFDRLAAQQQARTKLSPPSSWDYGREFLAMAKEEVAEWERHGVARDPTFLVPGQVYSTRPKTAGCSS